MDEMNENRTGATDPIGKVAAAAKPARAGRRAWIGLAVLALPCFLYSMDLTVLNLALPRLATALNPSAGQLLWIVDIYGFFVAASLITMGTLGDRIGRRRLLLIGAAAFAVASVFAAFSASAAQLIVARAVLGIAGATLAPSTLSLIRHLFADPGERRIAIGVWIASFSGGMALGPVVGGVLLTHFDWGSVFLVAVPVMALLLAIGPWLLPEYRDPAAGRIDLPSAALSLFGVLALVFSVKSIATGSAGAATLAAMAAGVALLGAFVVRQRRLTDPMIDLRLFRRRAFSASLGVNLFGVFTCAGVFLFLAQYFQLVLAMSPFEAALWTMPSGLVLAAGSMLAPWLLRHWSPARVIAGGLALSAVGYALLAAVRDAGDLPLLMTGFLVFCAGVSPIGAVSTDLVVGTAPPEQAGAAAAVSETSFEFGGAIGIALLGSLATWLYRLQMADFAPATAPPAVLAAARETLAAALAAAPALPDPDAAGLVQHARAAFTAAMRWGCAVSALCMLAAALLAARLLQQVRVEVAQAH
ncbi:MAG: MFS transporter [Lautropia sp.]